MQPSKEAWTGGRLGRGGEEWWRLGLGVIGVRGVWDMRGGVECNCGVSVCGRIRGVGERVGVRKRNWDDVCVCVWRSGGVIGCARE